MIQDFLFEVICSFGLKKINKNFKIMKTLNNQKELVDLKVNLTSSGTISEQVDGETSQKDHMSVSIDGEYLKKPVNKFFNTFFSPEFEIF